MSRVYLDARNAQLQRLAGSGPQVGTVRTWNPDRGFGFIEAAKTGVSVFAHCTSLETPEGRKDLDVGEAVEFSVALGADGRFKAVHVRPY